MPGDTFAPNALTTARPAPAARGLPATPDDSGIVVDALGGQPGIRSARFAGTGRDADNRRLLLERLGDAVDRSARFVCAAVLVDGDRVVERTASWEGTILAAERGAGGFGYDPVFVPADGGGRTAAELTAVETTGLSHRGRAFRALAAVIRG